MLDSHKKTQSKRRKRAAELIGLCAEVILDYIIIILELTRRCHCGKSEENDFYVLLRSQCDFQKKDVRVPNEDNS
jgi:hypothetical protein